jgi:pyruvate dehydrogenase E2 component (dihydrolipoamide acetyltransferase)
MTVSAIVVEIVMPKLGLTMESGVIARWLRQDGDKVVAGEPLFVVETEKSTVEVEAQESGTLRILPEMMGVDLSVGSVIGKIEKIEEMARAPSPRQLAVDKTSEKKPSQEPLSQQQTAAREGSPLVSTLEQPQPAAPPTSLLRPMVLPGATLPPKTIFLGGETSKKVQSITQKRLDLSVLPMVNLIEKITPLSGVRKVIADNMSASAHTTAAVTLTIEVDATQFVLLRSQLKEEFGKGDLIFPTYNDLILALVARCLAEYPEVNAVLTQKGIAQKAQVDIGLAIDTPKGLLVPVIRNVLNLSLWELAEATQRLIDLGQKGQLLPDDFIGGTFTITNLGMYDIDAFTPIINMPQVAVLGIGSIRPRPVSSEDRQVVIKDTVILSLTFDHRLIDGAPAARFLQRLKGMIEHVGVMLIAFP